MRKKNRMQKRKNRFHRWLAIVLMLILMAGQSHISAVAQEEAVPSGTEISDENKNDEGPVTYADEDDDGEDPEDPEEPDDPPAETTYEVTINVQKDGAAWSGHGKNFALSADNGNSMEAGLTVKAGTYVVFEVTGGSKTSTDVPVEVGENKDNTATVDYYTVTFHNGDTVYDNNDTSWKPQTVLKGTKAVKPTEIPPNDGYTFVDWMTENSEGPKFDFDTPIEKKTDLYAGWQQNAVTPPVVKDHTISATVTPTAGGRIDPPGLQTVPDGGSKEFRIIPSEGYQIKSVTVNGEDKTEDIKAENNSYTFTITNVKESCTIRVTFEREGGDPGNGDDDNSGGGDHGNSGSGNGDHGSSGGDNGSSGDAGNSGGGDNNGGNSGNGENVDGSNSSAGIVAAAGNSAAGSNSDGGVSGSSTGSKEPKTGDVSQAWVYATIAMIAGLTYLLLYVMEEGRGMSEQEKDALVAAFIRWAKKGGAFRRCCAMVAIFCVLAYYHSIGKRIGGNALDEKYLGQLS